MGLMWPLPDDLAEAADRVDETKPVFMAALMDVDSYEQTTPEFFRSTGRNVAKAQRLAYDAVGLPYTMVPEHEYAKAIRHLADFPGSPGVTVWADA